uniref:NADH dehydrogenase subunit 6 n=1 Tax=Iheyomytilidicola lauensis TaxID=998671 RepID=UPI001EDCB992|nr:NADH dehydrogenase subunit 6 [Iheyomytilidicola lauensis]UJV31455.1 NADH dehydrogenase subunit 6 [Iheyomytilidicola lauensis]
MTAINFFIFSLMTLASFFKTPINLCLTVVATNILLAMTLYLSHSTWIFLTFSMIYIGAMMVMFAYFSAISSTLTDSSLMMKEKLTILLQMMPITFLIFLLNPNLFPQSKPENFIMYIYASMETILFVFLFLILYFTMILVTKIIENMKSALRPWQ